MKRWLPNSTNKAFSLPELLVSLVLVSFVMVALIGLLREAVRFYSDQSVSLEVQKNVVVAMQKLAKELRESSPLSVGQGDKSITFASARDANDQVIYDNGELMWQKYVRFSVQEIDGSSVLLRSVQPLADPMADPPSAVDAVFATDAPSSVQARYIEDLRIKMRANSAELEIEAAFGDDVFRMILSTEVKIQN